MLTAVLMVKTHCFITRFTTLNAPKIKLPTTWSRCRLVVAITRLRSTRSIERLTIGKKEMFLKVTAVMALQRPILSRLAKREVRSSIKMCS